VRGCQQAQPWRRERLAIDLRLDLAPLREARTQEGERFHASDTWRARHEAFQALIAVDRPPLVDREVPRNAAQLVVDVDLERVPRGDVDRRQQRSDEERHQAERQHRPAAEDSEQSANHREPAEDMVKSSGFRNVNKPFQTASGAMTSPLFALNVTPAGCTIPVDRPLMMECGGTSPSSPSSFQTPMKPSLPVFHGDGSSTSAESPARGLSTSYGGRYSLLIAAT